MLKRINQLKYKKIIISLIVILILFGVGSVLLENNFVQAQTSNLAPIPAHGNTTAAKATKDKAKKVDKKCAGKIMLQVSVPGIGKCVTGFPEYIKAFYKLFIGVVGILAVILIMVGGFQWLLAAGNAQKITGAKTTIISAIMGLVLALTSYTILNVINPKVLDLKLKPDIIKLTDNTVIGSEASGICTDALAAEADTAGLLYKPNYSTSLWGMECGQTYPYAKDKDGNITKSCYGPNCSNGDTICLLIEGKASCVGTVEINDTSSKNWGLRTYTVDEGSGLGGWLDCPNIYYNNGDFYFGADCHNDDVCFVNAAKLNIVFSKTYEAAKKANISYDLVGTAKEGYTCVEKNEKHTKIKY